MPRLKLLLPLLLALALIEAPAAAAGCKGRHVLPAQGNVKQVRKATLCLINVRRQRHGLVRLRQHRRLRKAARRYSRAMVRRGFFDHVAPSGSTLATRVSRLGYRRWAALGENIAWGTEHLATPRAIVRGWMRSPGHRRNILRPGFREIGIGIARGAPAPLRANERAATYTTKFGVRR